MMDDEFWKAVREREQAKTKTSPTGAINMALLFGTAAIALTLILTPLLTTPSKDRNLAGITPSYDTITTGSIPSGETGKRRYTIRKSILQNAPGSVCIIDVNGASSGC